MTASARGLFRATGKKGEPLSLDEGSDLAGPFVREVLLERETDDFYPTPPEPTRALLAAEIDRLRQFPSIWEGHQRHDRRKAHTAAQRGSRKPAG